MKKRTNLMKRVLSFIMAFAMILTLVPATVFAAETPTTLYLQPNSNWTMANARFAAYFFGNGETWVSMTDADGDGVYEVKVPSGYPSVIFCRMDPSATANNWTNKWNQTSDLTVPTDGTNCYTVQDGTWDEGGGSWSTHTPAETDPDPEPEPDPVTYTVYCINSAKWDAVAAYAWTGSNANTEWPGVLMTKTSETVNGFDVYSVTFDVAYENVIFNNNDKGSQTGDLTLENGKYYDVKSGAWYASLSDVPAIDVLATDCYLAGSFNDWSTTANEFELDAEGSQTGYVSLELAAETDYEFKVVQDGTWTSCETTITDTVAGLVFSSSVGNNVKITTTIAGTYVFAFDVSGSTLSVTYPEAEEPSEPEDTEPNTYEATFHFADVLGWGTVNLYTWTDAGTHCGSWPGTAVSKGDDGFYTMTVSFEAETNTGLNFIFNNGSVQTVDLLLPASAFVDNKAEKWVVLTTQTDSGYNAAIVDSAKAIVTSPVVADSSVTFNYYNETATSVYVAGSFNGWSTTANQMTKDEDGVWTTTIEDLAAGDYQYKFVVDGEWTTDLMNGSIVGENSAFTILSSSDVADTNEITINVHYTRSDGNYDGWNLWVWGSAIAGHQVDFEKTDSDGSKVATIVLKDARAHSSISFKERLSVEGNEWKEQGDSNRTIDLSTIVSGTIDYYIPSGECTYDVVHKNKISSVSLNYDTGVVTFTTAQQIADPANEVTLVKVEGETETTVEATVSGGGTTYTLTLNAGTWDLKTLYRYEVTFDGYPYAIGIDAVYASEKFATEYTYTGEDLGATWSSASTTFKVWAPTAEAVSVKLYDLSDKVYTARETTYPMTAGANGTWAVTIDGDLNGVYYNYLVTVDGGDPVEAVDPYARTTGVNGKIGMVIDLDSTDPDGWASDENPNEITSYTDAIIYELHVRDFSIDDSSGVSAANRGKYLAFTEEGTKTSGGVSTGIDYLDELGITHLHLLPVYDYGSVDETTCNTFNWGYDPVNYNTPEGSYSSNPYDGATRVNEFKQMVKSLHDHDISVIMDVVYNHVYDADKFCFNNIVPGYFSRVNSNRSGCGNDTASEREMVRKYIVESVLYWAEEYHIDGFRFDLVGLLDVQTINQIVEEVHKVNPYVIFYGEGWDMDDTNREPGTEMAKQGNASKTTGFAYFSDSMRNGIAGSNGTSTGFVSGAGNGSSMVTEWLANPWWTSNPEQVIQYASCHDNYTLIDKLILSTGAPGITDDIISMNNLAAAYYMTSQGIAFIHAGEEMLREKLEENGDRCENSYNASDYVNHIEWSNLEKDDYADTSAYYQGLIEFRNAHPALRYDTAAEVSANVKNTMSSANVVAFQIDGNAAGDDDIYIIFNAGTSATTVTLPTGTWTININKADAGTESLDTASGSVSVDGISAMVLTKADEGKDSASSSGTVTLYFTNNKNWSNVYAYAWDVNGNAVTAAWPGTEMTWVENNSFGQDVYSVTLPASATGVVFNGGGDETKTEDLEVGVDGTGYYFDNEGVIVSYTYRDPVSGGDSGETGNASDYYLRGYINNAEYIGTDYLFTDGTVTVNFDADSYVYVVNGNGTETYMTDGWQGAVTSATLYDVAKHTSTADKWDKFLIPSGTEVTISMVKNDNNTVTLSYEAAFTGVVDASGIQDGVTLHCWNWSFAEIEDKMDEIAAMGFTAVQTSPIQPLKETTIGSGKTVEGNWWVYYQPVDFKINTAEGNALGTRTELASMIETAHEYGIQVIVDVVANHLANEYGNDLSPAIPDYLLASEYWHDINTNINSWDDRYDMTQHCLTGLPDLNTANKEIQGYVLNFLKDCVDIGVDGFRFDMAKSIETPRDDASFASEFWPTVVNGVQEYAGEKDLYIYGEILDDPKISISAYTEYMAVTDNSWGNQLRSQIAAGTASVPVGYHKAAHASQLVIWAESHDTYATDDASQNSAGVSVANINKTWAIVAARGDIMGLYLARPESLTQALGVASVTGWANDEVKAVNEFRNAFAGQDEFVDAEGSIAYVERGTSGVVLVNAAGTTASVSVTANKIADGTYIDQITGNTFTVANGTISGEIGDTGIAVVVKLIDLEGATMTLGNSLAMNFVIDTAELTGTDNYAVITKDYADGTGSKSVTINQANWKVYDGTMYYFTYSKVAAKEMTDKITVVVYNSAGETVTNSWTDSVRDYCMRALANTNESKKATLYVDMLNYGAAAQTYFNGYHANDLANSQLTDDQKALATGDVTFENNQVKPESGYIGSTLLLENNILFNFVFSNNVVASKAVITYTNHYNKAKTVTVESADFQTYSDDQGNTGWYLSVTNMAVADGCQVEGKDFLMTCKLYDANGAEMLTVQDSVASYLARANANTNNDNPLYTLILKFATSAYNYFH